MTRNTWLYKEYFDLIASGRKTVEVRVGYPSMRRIYPPEKEALGVLAIEVERV
ncbi:hypothetical protein LI90_3632 [Carbonactinospora thermoautotrophica]|uniref:ASCH domain-containing protein n=1 Tax=Carbonactinospora thermoautotrophica TaxID=1469144 RepID=A0A132MXL5_9ACTN|nr:ASCH domain-containing protein [Carbonactinospora thermoautotrophica]KWX02589.1 hypothetical protein LI90_3632 [Carbonactinospora thermoautotrophica]